MRNRTTRKNSWKALIKVYSVAVASCDSFIKCVSSALYDPPTKKSPAKRQSSTVHYEIHDGFLVRKNMTWRTTHSPRSPDGPIIPTCPSDELKKFEKKWNKNDTNDVFRRISRRVSRNRSVCNYYYW
mmetsp:Transcript_20507/g.23496  ORF Transcript_20507/g.23496 Transcript_20507/m.23496 type:complete len:127 (-) Transcript_20507:198-578(-)